MCKCVEGYVGDGIICRVDTTPFVAPTSAPFASCATVNEEGSIACDLEKTNCEVIDRQPTCVCKDGYFSIGLSCLEVDECRTEALTNCTAGGRSECINTPGSYRCQCATGYTDFPESIAGTDCRTDEEIAEALASDSPSIVPSLSPTSTV
mmetsp:Transcript_30278/g.42913  ORF Transcript_30278/g.42913 Transcript_30278/m.42913 type:complete len:150 (+) Transcript_30278:413-862(+)